MIRTGADLQAGPHLQGVQRSAAELSAQIKAAQARSSQTLRPIDGRPSHPHPPARAGDLAPEAWLQARGGALLAIAGALRVSAWTNCAPGRSDLPRTLPEFHTLGVVEAQARFASPAAPPGVAAHQFRQVRPAQGVMTGRPTRGLELVLISPKTEAGAQALRDWADFVHIRHIAAAAVPGFTLITPYENVDAGAALPAPLRAGHERRRRGIPAHDARHARASAREGRAPRLGRPSRAGDRLRQHLPLRGRAPSALERRRLKTPRSGRRRRTKLSVRCSARSSAERRDAPRSTRPSADARRRATSGSESDGAGTPGGRRRAPGDGSDS